MIDDWSNRVGRWMKVGQAASAMSCRCSRGRLYHHSPMKTLWKVTTKANWVLVRLFEVESIGHSQAMDPRAFEMNHTFSSATNRLSCCQMGQRRRVCHRTRVRWQISQQFKWQDFHLRKVSASERQRLSINQGKRILKFQPCTSTKLSTWHAKRGDSWNDRRSLF